MKILRIRLSNLNSLKGDHLVDLTTEPLASAGLFVITGATGAGKSTLLDAITLALFGRAARYGNESNPEHVMSRHCGHCSAEVEFEVPSGVYRATWERRRARSKPDGVMQPPKRYIYDSAGQPLAQQIREAETMIEGLLGLNYDRFLRSALLAQGEFARFLKAKPDERAELLESLTGTEIYSRLGSLAHSEANRRDTDLKAKESALEHVAVLDDETRQELDAAYKRDEGRRNQLDKDITEGGKMLEKINALQTARSNQQKASSEQDGVQKDRKAAAADLERLRLHRLTVPFAADLARLDAAEVALKSSESNREKAVKAHAAATSALARATFILRASTESALASRKRDAEKAVNDIAKANEKAATARKWITEHQQDAGLANRVGDLATAIGDLKTARGAFDDAWSDWTGPASQVLPGEASSLPGSWTGSQESELAEVLEAFLEKARSRGSMLETAVADAKKQFELRKDHLEKAKLVAKLEDHRHNLKAGEACPLCGALDHPFAEGAVPGAQIAELEGEKNKAEGKLEEARDGHKHFNQIFKALEKDRERLIGNLRKRSELSGELADKLQPLSVPLPEPGKEDILRKDLQNRDRDYRGQTEELKDAEREAKEIQAKATAASTAVKELEVKLGKLPPLPADAETVAIPLGDLPPVSEAEELHSEALIQEGITGNQAAERKGDESKATEGLSGIKAPLEAAVADSEFNTLEKLKEARLPRPETERIEAIDRNLGERKTAADALLKQADQEIGGLLEQKVLEGEEAGSFRSLLGEHKGERDKLLEVQAGRRLQQETDEANRKLRKQMVAQLDEEREALVVWRKLRELIGSHDGSKFRRYAQTISLDILTRHANRHLVRLSDRYRICRDQEEALNLLIEDLHQAAVRRPMASLSGGESFLVSLALALGLSDLAGRTVRIDSLFVDEGFGTLDPETLEVAIAALESLRQDHKTVGIISHVALLKERISTQILVEKQTGGVSRISVIS